MIGGVFFLGGVSARGRLAVERVKMVRADEPAGSATSTSSSDPCQLNAGAAAAFRSSISTAQLVNDHSHDE